MDPFALTSKLTAAYGPAGQEDEIREVVQSECHRLGYKGKVDGKGNFVIPSGSKSSVLVTAHLDEIALIVTAVLDGELAVTSLGGIHPWKLGEGPVAILGEKGPIDGVLGFGSIHSDAPNSICPVVEQSGLAWSNACVFTGLTDSELAERGVGVGSRVVVHKSRRALQPVGEFISGYFLDDRADLASWLLALAELKDSPLPATFAATAAEEVGGEGAQYLMHALHPEVCIALELGPVVPDSTAKLNPNPTLWVKDGYSTMASADIHLVQSVAKSTGVEIQLQALSRGGSDATCAASRGLCARPITLGLPMENSHGFEIIHRDAVENLAKLTVALVQQLARK